MVVAYLDDVHVLAKNPDILNVYICDPGNIITMAYLSYGIS